MSINANKSHLIETGTSNVQFKQHSQSVSNSIGVSKRISFSELHNANKVLGNDGSDEAKKLYCMVDSRKNSQSSLHNSLSQVQIHQVDALGNNKSSAMGKVQLKTKDKMQNY